MTEKATNSRRILLLTLLVFLYLSYLCPFSIFENDVIILVRTKQGVVSWK